MDANKNNTAAPQALIREFEKFCSSGALRIIEQEAMNHFEDSFRFQGFTDKNFERWPERKPPKRNGKRIKGKALERWREKDRGRAILMGDVKRTKGVHMANSIVSDVNEAEKRTSIILDKPYAQVHNGGLKAGRPPGFMMPQRRFIGPSVKLEEKIHAKIEKEITKIMKKY